MSKSSSPVGSPSGAPTPTRQTSSPISDSGNLNLKWKRTSSPPSSASQSPVLAPTAPPAPSPGSRPASPSSRAKLALSLETFAAPPASDRVASPKHTKDVTPSTPTGEAKSMTPRLVEEIATTAVRQRSQLLQDIDASGFAISVSSPTHAAAPSPDPAAAPAASGAPLPLLALGGDKSRLLSRRSSQLHLNLVIARDDSAVVMQPRSAGGPLKKDSTSLADTLPALPTIEQLKEMLLPRSQSVSEQKEPSSAGANGSLGSKQRTPQEPLSSRGAGPRRFSKQFAVSQFPPHNFKDTEEHQRVRLKVLEELLATEITYVKEFDALVNRYFVPIVNAKLMPTHKARSTVEASLHHASEILRVHSHFLEELKKVCDKSFDAGQIMKVFLEYVEFMRVYQPYVQNHYYLMNDFRSGDLPRSLKKFLELTTEEIKKTGIVKQDIAQLLIVPVQRIPRYVLLLERLEKETPEMHGDIMVIRLALEKARRIGDQVNESLKQSENSGRLFDYHQKIKGLPPVVKILSPTRIFVEEGTFTDVTEEPDHPPAPEGHPHKGSCRLILFNDLLLITDYKYAYKTHVDMIFLAATARSSSVFEVKSGINQSKAVMILLADSPQQQSSWLEHIEAANAEFLEQQNEITKRSAKVRHAAPSLSVTDKERPASRSVSQVSSSSSTRRSMPSDIPKIESVNLFLRVRPFVTKEEKELGVKCLDVDDNIAVLEMQEKDRIVEKVGVYDDVFPDYCSQSDVFDRVGQQTLGGLFAGYNTAVFAYGNTGAGKTHTMFGDMNSAEAKGLVPRMLEALFEVIDTPNLFEQSEVRLAYLQVYNNEIQDLQADNPAETSLSVMQTGDGTVIKGMIQKRIKSSKEGIAIVVDGNKKRVTRKHNMNEMSSRSHAVLLVDLITKKADEPKTRVTLYLIDLAGSENAKDTGAVGEALTECMFINKSLTALMRVVSTLLENQTKEDKRREKVPFRDSALTHLLTDVLGGSFVCSMILNVSASPAHDQASLTAKTMQFGAGVKKLDLKAQTGRRVGPSVKDWLVGVWKSVARSSDWEEADEKEQQNK